MKFISWNVNGLRACMGKDFEKTFLDLDADFFCLQETKMQQGQLDLAFPGYTSYWNYAQKKGYSGTAIFTKHRPLSVRYGMFAPALSPDITCPPKDIVNPDMPEYKGELPEGETGEKLSEGRVITLEYEDFYFITMYVPNSQDGLKRLSFRMKWEDEFLRYIKALDAEKPVIFCGDLNVAHQEIDLKNPKTNHMNAGFTDEEREKFSAILASGFIDSFRTLHPEEVTYSWWSYRFKAREKNTGWRIDYFVTSERLKSRISSASIHTDIFGSDHCPVELILS